MQLAAIQVFMATMTMLVNSVPSELEGRMANLSMKIKHLPRYCTSAMMT